MAKKAPKALRPSEHFAARLREARKRRGWSQEDLAARLTELGHPMTQPIVARLEKGGRGVTLDDAFACGVALGVNPAALFFPLAGAERVALTPQVVVNARKARSWIRGQGALRDEDRVSYNTELPDEDDAAREYVELQMLYNGYRRLIDAIFDRDDAAAKQAIADMGSDIARVERVIRERRDRE